MEEVSLSNTFVRIHQAAKYQIYYSLSLKDGNFCGLLGFCDPQNTCFLHLF